MSQEQERLFAEMLDESWKLYNEMEFDREIPGVFICGLAAALVAEGWALIDFNGAGGEASSLQASSSAPAVAEGLAAALAPPSLLGQLRFERLGTGERLRVEVSHVRDGVSGRVLGRRANILLGYGERVQDAGRLWQTLKQEFKSGFIAETEPGIIRFDAEVTTGYIYATVGLLWDLNHFVDKTRAVDYPLVQSRVGAVVHSLGKYLRGRLA